MNDRDSLIYLPHGGSGEFSDLADRIRAASAVPDRSLIVPIQQRTSNIAECQQLTSAWRY
jgi:hypothetical protein